MYKTALNISLLHEYYPAGNCPASLAPSAATARLLSRHDILFRRQNANQWLLVSQNGLSALAETLQFTVHATGDTLYYVTRSWKPGPGFTVEATNAPGAWQTVTVNVQYLIENSINEITVEAGSEEKYLEYLCIPKYNSAGIALRMAEEKNRVQIKEIPATATLPDGTIVRRFVTAEKIKLQRDSNITMQLWERRDSGDRLIGNAIQSPDPRQPSPFGPKDTIARFYYY